MEAKCPTSSVRVQARRLLPLDCPPGLPRASDELGLQV